MSVKRKNSLIVAILLLIVVLIGCQKKKGLSLIADDFFDHLDSAVYKGFIPIEKLLNSEDFSYSTPLNIEYKGYGLFVAKLSNEDAVYFKELLPYQQKFSSSEGFKVVGKNNICSELPIINPNSLRIAGVGLGFSEDWELYVVNFSCSDVLLKNYRRHPDTTPGFSNGYFIDLKSKEIYFYILVY